MLYLVVLELEVAGHVIGGARLSRPSHLSAVVYRLIQDCWESSLMQNRKVNEHHLAGGDLTWMQAFEDIVATLASLLEDPDATSLSGARLIVMK